MAKRGAPRKYDRRKVLNYICQAMARGDRCLEDICKDDGLPAVENIYLWVNEETEEGEELFKIFMRAQQLWCWAQNDRIIKIADDESRDIILDAKGNQRSDNTAVNRDKLRITARQWAMTKLAAKHFGDKVSQEISGPDGGAVAFTAIVDRPPKETPEEWQKRVSAQIQDRQRLRTED